MATKTLEPAFAFHPGEMIAEELEARGWTQQEFATIIAKPQGKLNDIIKGKANITPEWAILIGKAFGTSPNLWLGIQQEYDLYKAKKSIKMDRLSDIELLSQIKSLIPVKELVKFGFIQKKWNTATELRDIICNFLNITDFDSKVFSLKPAFKKSNKDNINDNNMNVWLRIIENRAKAQNIKSYKEDGLNELLNKINEFICDESSGIDKFIRELANVGVLVSFARHFEKTGVDGVSFWIETNGQKNPVIGMSLRHNKYDNFWFTLLHELGHIVKRHNEDSYIYDDEDSMKENVEGEGKEKEKEANDWAKNILIPQNLNDSLYKLGNNIISIMRFCNTNKIHRSIVLGRLKSDGCIDWSRYNNFHLVKVRDKLTVPTEFNI